VFVELILDLPTGWEKQQERAARKCIDVNVGKRNDRREHLNTCHRKNMVTLFDDEGVLTQTANRSMHRVDTDLNDADLVEEFYAQIAYELDKTVDAVKIKVSVAVIGDQYDAMAHIDINKVAYNERQ
jgi:hypothetical protein